MAPTDEALLSKWQAGDQRAGEELFARHFQSLFRFFCWKASDAAEDLTQETLVACVKGGSAIGGPGKFRPYMFAVARRLLHAHYERKHNPTTDPPSRSLADPGPGMESHLAAQQEEKVLLQALRTLPLDYQIAIELHSFEGLTGPELAEVLEVPEGTVRSRLRRARLQLEAQVRAMTESPELLQSTLSRLEDWVAGIRGIAPP